MSTISQHAERIFAYANPRIEFSITYMERDLKVGKSNFQALRQNPYIETIGHNRYRLIPCTEKEFLASCGATPVADYTAPDMSEVLDVLGKLSRNLAKFEAYLTEGLPENFSVEQVEHVANQVEIVHNWLQYSLRDPRIKSLDTIYALFNIED